MSKDEERSVEAALERALETFRTRGEEYGNTWDTVGEITHALYPGGITLVAPEDYAKFHILQWQIGKLVRYANSGSVDSIHDAGVYAFILEAIERGRT
jgi:hypothetical protein